MKLVFSAWNGVNLETHAVDQDGVVTVLGSCPQDAVSFSTIGNALYAIKAAGASSGVYAFDGTTWNTVPYAPAQYAAYPLFKTGNTYWLPVTDAGLGCVVMHHTTDFVTWGIVQFYDAAKTLKAVTTGLDGVYALIEHSDAFVPPSGATYHEVVKLMDADNPPVPRTVSSFTANIAAVVNTWVSLAVVGTVPHVWFHVIDEGGTHPYHNGVAYSPTQLVSNAYSPLDGLGGVYAEKGGGLAWSPDGVDFSAAGVSPYTRAVTPQGLLALDATTYDTSWYVNGAKRTPPSGAYTVATLIGVLLGDYIVPWWTDKINSFEAL